MFLSVGLLVLVHVFGLPISLGYTLFILPYKYLVTVAYVRDPR